MFRPAISGFWSLRRVVEGRSCVILAGGANMPCADEAVATRVRRVGGSNALCLRKAYLRKGATAGFIATHALGSALPKVPLEQPVFSKLAFRPSVRPRAVAEHAKDSPISL